MKSLLILAFSFASLTNAAPAGSCQGKSSLFNGFCAQYKAADCQAHSGMCRWGGSEHGDRCGLYNGDERACGNVSMCEWTDARCEGGAFCGNLDEHSCGGSGGCSWTDGQCSTR